MSDVTEMPIADLAWSDECQARERMSAEVVNNYAEAYREGRPIPPLEAFEVNGELFIVDGFHRHEAAELAGLVTLPVVIVGSGTLADAVWEALQKNHAHGLPRSREDKRKAVRMALELDSSRSNREIARITGTAHPFVGKMRGQLMRQAEMPQPEHDAQELREEADSRLREGQTAHAMCLYEQAARVASDEERPALERRADFCREKIAPQKRADRIFGASQLRHTSECSQCGREAVAGMRHDWTEIAVCQECIDTLQAEAEAERAQEPDQAEAAE